MKETRRGRHTKKSSCCGPMVPSLTQEDVLELGQALVKELGLDRSTDTLGRWMAHHLAELLTKAENEANAVKRAKAKEKCCETILELWEHRASMPENFRPLGNLEKVLAAIVDLRNNDQPWSILSPSQNEKIGGPWLAFVKIRRTPLFGYAEFLSWPRLLSR